MPGCGFGRATPNNLFNREAQAPSAACSISLNNNYRVNISHSIVGFCAHFGCVMEEVSTESFALPPKFRIKHRLHSRCRWEVSGRCWSPWARLNRNDTDFTVPDPHVFLLCSKRNSWKVESVWIQNFLKIQDIWGKFKGVSLQKLTTRTCSNRIN